MTNDINDKIFRLITGKLSQEEEAFLEKRMQEDPSLREKIQAMREASDLNEAWEIFNSIDDKKALKSLRKKIYNINKVKRETGFSIYFSDKLRVAAAIVLLLVVVGATLWYNDYTKITLPETPVHPIGELLDNDNSANVPGNNTSDYVAVKSKVDKNELSNLQLDAATAEKMLKAENITTYDNKEYWLTLPDGTAVHLDSNSRIIYPEHFPKATPWNPHPVREVVLRGKAYFMVAKDKSRKFVVHTAQGDIVDYGTEFFVSTEEAEDASELHVALIKGKVGVKSSASEEKILRPGEEANIKANNIEISEVDTSPYVAWNTGTFSFEGYSLEKLMDVISMWYGVEVEFASDKLRSKMFDGVLSRYEPIDNLLKSLNLIMSLKIKRNGNKVIVAQ